MHILPQWSNKHRLLPHIKDKRGELEMAQRLAALIKQVAKLCDIGLRACHCAKEFTLWRIRPLGRHEKLAYECPRLADPSRDPTDSKILISISVVTNMLF
jgi:hypothetical protein